MCERLTGWFCSVVLLLICGTLALAGDEGKKVRVLIQTDKGEFEVELEPAKAPATTANFLKYVDGKFYDGGRFHRTVKPDNQPDNKVKIEVIQAGVNPAKRKEEPAHQAGTDPSDEARPQGRDHLDGPRWPRHRHGRFFRVRRRPAGALDFGGKRNPDGQGFAAFGRVVKGMDVVRKIQAAPAEGQTLTPPVKILKITRQR